MKKIITMLLLLSMLLSFAACAAPQSTAPQSTIPQSTAPQSTAPQSAAPQSTAHQSTAPEITLQEVYEAGKNLAALLGNHENVSIVITFGETVLREEYLSKQFFYSFSAPEYMNMGFEYADFTTDHSQYVYYDGAYALNVTLTPDGMIDGKESLASVGTRGFVSLEVANDAAATIVEKDGSIIVTCNADPDEIATMGEDIVSCVEIYTLDAKTREMTSVKTVYTYADGTVEEGIATISRDVEAPEGAKPFLKYEQERENLRTVTIVSNPGTENEKTETVMAPKGLAVGLSPDFSVDAAFTMYADAACTQIAQDDADLNSDRTVYVRWDV